MSQYSPPVATNELQAPTDTQPITLPSQGQLVGRTGECQEVRQLLQARRLVTLVGPGGIGKTSLAAAVAAENLPYFQDGVYFVSLAGVTSSLFLVSAIAEAVHFAFYEPGDFKAQLLEFLRQRQILLVLDNYEHLLPNVDLVIEILQVTQRVSLLVTSRQHLGLRDEWVYELSGLSYPSGEASFAAEQYGAVALFALRAQSVSPRFSLNQANLADVVAICRLVDGLPLALELAASWTRALSCAEIASQIEKDIDFLATHWQDFPEKHRRMRGVLAQSWNMLEPPEQAVMKRLAVFQGAICLQAAGQVAEASPQELAALIDRSMLHYEPTGFYKLHPLMRQYALEQWDTSVELERVAANHCNYFAAFLHRQEADLRGAGQRAALERIGAEIENVRQAWDWAVAQRLETPVALCLQSLYEFYLLRGYYRDGEKCFGETARRFEAVQACALVSRLIVRQGVFLRHLGSYAEAQNLLGMQLPVLEKQAEPDDILICLRELAHIAYHQGAYAEARRLGMECLSRCDAQGNLPQGIQIRHVLSNVAREIANYDEARQHLEDALALSDAGRFPQLHAQCLQNLGIFHRHQGNTQEARVYFENALRIFTEIADRPGESQVLSGLAAIFIHQSLYSRAIRCYERVIPVLREIGDQRSLGRALGSLGVLFQRLGCAEKTHANLEQSLTILRQVGEKRGSCVTLSNLSLFFHSQGEFSQAEAFAQELLATGVALGDRTAQAYAWNNLGDALLGQRDWQGAADAYQCSLALRRELGETHLLFGPLMGLADVALAQGNLPLALHYAELLLAPEHDGDSRGQSLDVMFACYRVLQANRDSRATVLLRQAHERLQFLASSIDDDDLRRSFLENVPAHRGILAAYPPEDVQSIPPGSVVIAGDEADLTPRELEVLRYMAAGYSNQEIAGCLFISLSTVKRHITNLHHKLGAKRRTQAISLAKELGLLVSQD
jgi:predicted ATPase/DNA-binding CsgD family transcriptional regulator/Tfp pilus assembly protein PilF